MAIGLTPTKTNPLISFYTIIDEDLSLLFYIADRYRESNVFITNELESDNILPFIGKIYRRKKRNPLYYIMRDESYKDLLDRCYDEFINEYEADILDYAISTGIINLIKEFVKSNEVIPTILYYSDAQLKALNEIEELKNVEKINFEEALSKVNHFSHFYFKSIEEINPFKDKFKNTTIYLSTCGLNLNEANNDLNIDNDLIVDFIKRNVRLAIFDMYRTDMIGDYSNGNNNQ